MLAMAKIFVDAAPLEFSHAQPMDYERVLWSTDRREEFALNVERGGRMRARLKYQTRARRIVVLARLELTGRRHRNPPEAPYKGGESTFTCTARALTTRSPTSWLMLSSGLTAT